MIVDNKTDNQTSAEAAAQATTTTEQQEQAWESAFDDPATNALVVSFAESVVADFQEGKTKPLEC